MDLAKKFYFAWCDKVNARKKELENTWRNSKAYTKTIIHSNSSILIDISETLGFKCFNADYYFIDAVFFKPEDLVPEITRLYFCCAALISHRFKVAASKLPQISVSTIVG